MAHPLAPLSTLEAINQRRSVRSFRSTDISRETVRQLLAAAVRAPTAMHQEPWAFAVIQDRQLLKRLSDRAKPLALAEMQRADCDAETLRLFAHPNFNIFYNAGTLILICGRIANPMAVADCWLAAENLMLAACAMSLGSCVIGSASEALNTPPLKVELGIPEDMQVVAPIIVGVPDEAGKPSPRKEPQLLGWK